MTDKEAKQAAEVAAAEDKLKQFQGEADEVIERLGRAVKHDMATDEEKGPARRMGALQRVAEPH